MLKRVRNWLVVERTASFSDADYDAAVRMRLDTTLLPKPVPAQRADQPRAAARVALEALHACAPQQVPAPVESREPKGATR